MEDKKIELDSVELWQLLDFVASLARGDYDGDENAGAAAVGFVASHLSEAAFEFPKRSLERGRYIMDLMTKFLRENAPGFEFDESCNMEAFAKGADIFLSSFENTLVCCFSTMRTTMERLATQPKKVDGEFL